MNWKYITESDEVSLHDCIVTEWLFGEDITLNFEDGFDVCRTNPLNDTGRHKRTGESAVILKNAKFISAEYSAYTVTHSDKTTEEIPATELTFDEIAKFVDATSSGARPITIRLMNDEIAKFADVEILSSDYENGVFTLTGLAGIHDGDFFRVLLSCDKPLYCWNEFTDDAWFQDYPKGNV